MRWNKNNKIWMTLIVNSKTKQSLWPTTSLHWLRKTIIRILELVLKNISSNLWYRKILTHKPKTRNKQWHISFLHLISLSQIYVDSQHCARKKLWSCQTHQFQEHYKSHAFLDAHPGPGPRLQIDVKWA